MRRIEKFKRYLIGKDNEEVSWLLYFIVSCIVSGVLAIIVTLIRLI
jgi:hypothetical protein